jgi:glucose/arabinose dehydrogenase
MPGMKRAYISLLVATTFTLFQSCGSDTKPGSVVLQTATEAELYKKYKLYKIKLPPGFSISVFAEVPNARSITISPSGTVFVGNRKGDKVYAVQDLDSNGRADKVYTIASGLDQPNGVAFNNGSLFIATVSTIYRIDNIEQKLISPTQLIPVYDKFPNDAHHGWKFIAFGPDGKLYVPVGAPCNICLEKNPVYASITRMNADGSGFEIFARGIRNTVGFAWHPSTKEMWFTENGADEMGDDVPYCELNNAPTPGLHFGFPFCHQGNIPDKEFTEGKACDAYVPPVQNLAPHVAPLGMRFYTGSSFPTSYTNNIFMAEHGSWNRSKPIGYRITLARTDTAGNVNGYTIFAEGWLQPNGEVLGRPVDVEVMKDGSILVSDDYSGVIYRITYQGAR